MEQQEQPSRRQARKVFLRPTHGLPEKLTTEFLDNHAVDLPEPLSTSIDATSQVNEETVIGNNSDSIAQTLALRRNDALRTLKVKLEGFRAKYLKRSRDPHAAPSARGYDSFEDILHVLDEASANYKSQGGVSRALMKLSEALGRNGKAIKAWLDLLPDGEYTSVVCGSFKLVIMAAVRVSDIRETIFDALARIPKAVQRARRLKDLYGPQFEAEEYSIFYCSVLEACEAMLAWLSKASLHDKVKAVGSAFFKQTEYEKSLDSKLDRVDQAAKDVDREASVRFQESFRDHTETYTADIRRLLGEINGGRLVMSGALSGVKGALQSLLEAREKDASMFQDHLQSCTINQVTLKELQSILHTAVEPYEDDRKTMLEQAGAFENASYARCEMILRASEIYHWMLTPTSKLLVIEANLGGGSIINPVSYTCALLAEALGYRKRGVIMLSAFCSLHLDMDSPNSGLKQVMIALLLQLLHNFPEQSVYSMPDAKTLKGLHKESKSFSSLISTFKNILRQLPSNVTVFCIVDGLGWYEDNYQEVEVRKVVTMLQELVTQEAIMCPFKVLLTTATRLTEETRSLVDDDQRLWLPEDSVFEQQGWNPEDWQSSTQGLLRQASMPQEDE